MDIEAELARLKSLFDKGLIDEAEYREEKKAVLSSSRPSGSIPPQPSGVPQGTAMSLVAGMTIGPDNNRLFRLEKKLGGGAMGEVWKAEDMAESKIVGHIVWVAVKALIPFLSAGERHREALKREAINAKKLSHAHIIRTHDWYEDKVDGFPFLVMEYLEGQTLDQKLAQAGHFTYAETLDILNPIVEALAYAWEEHRIVHRDLKPDNIYLTAEGKLKLLDFGIAAQVRNTASAVGLSGFDSPGTLGYAPPEAGANRKPDPRFDIYSLGILSYELLEGQLPFNGLRQTTTPLPEKPEALNEAQWQVLIQAMAYDTQERHHSTEIYLTEFRRAEGPSAEEIERQKQEYAAQAAATEEAERKAREEAAEMGEDSLWQAACQQETEQAYYDYLNKSQRMTYKQLALEKIAALKLSTMAGDKKSSDKLLCCSFCGKTQHEVRMLIAGPEVFVCDECVTLCNDIIREDIQPDQETIGTMAGVNKSSDKQLCCSFCGKHQDEVHKLIAGPEAFVCDECISECDEIIRTETEHIEPSVIQQPPQHIKVVRYEPLTVFRDGFADGSGQGPEMVWLPQGSFRMGSNDHDDGKPVHEVRIAYPLAVGKYPVTFEEWDRYAAEEKGAHKPDDSGWGRGRRPVMEVSWDDAHGYCAWLTRKTGHSYRLLSEAEWEYACRAGTATEYYWGDSEAGIGEYAVYEGNSNGETAEVGSKRPNPWGLYDMNGNVWEWVEDSYHADYKDAPVDGSVWQGDGAYRVLRGDSWNDESLQFARAAFRNWFKPAFRINVIGFRLARMLP